MWRWLCSFAAVWLALVAAAAPAMVTTTRGGVELVRPSGPTPAPAPPFLLGEDEGLRLADGALVVVLHEGTATQLLGPREVARDDLKTREATAQAGAAALDALMTRRVELSSAGASRGGGAAIRLTRPVPGTRVVGLPYVEWACEGCGDEGVALYDFRNDRDVWRGVGERRVAYDGPPLEPGGYLLTLGERDHALTVASADEARELAELVAAATRAMDDLAGAGADAAARTSILASVQLQAGYPSEALYTVDAALVANPGDPHLLALQASLERLAGLAP